MYKIKVSVTKKVSLISITSAISTPMDSLMNIKFELRNVSVNGCRLFAFMLMMSMLYIPFLFLLSLDALKFHYDCSFQPLYLIHRSRHMQTVMNSLCLRTCRL